MGAKQSNPLYPSRALRADPSADDSSVGEDNLSVVVFSNERPHSAESKGGFFNLEHYLRDHERRMSTPERPLPSRQGDPAPVDEPEIRFFTQVGDGAHQKALVTTGHVRRRARRGL